MSTSFLGNKGMYKRREVSRLGFGAGNRKITAGANYPGKRKE